MPLTEDLEIINGLLKHFGEDTVSISNETNQKEYRWKCFKGFYNFDNKYSGKHPMFNIDWIDKNSHKIIIPFPEKTKYSQNFEVIYNHKMEFSIFKKYRKQAEFVVGNYIELNCNEDTITQGEYAIKEVSNKKIKKSLRGW